MEDLKSLWNRLCRNGYDEGKGRKLDDYGLGLVEDGDISMLFQGIQQHIVVGIGERRWA